MFAVTGLARGGTLTVLQALWPRLDAHGSIRVISHGPDSVAIDRPVSVIGARFSAPMRFPAIWVYAARMLWACVKATRGSERAVLLPQDSAATGAAAAVAGRLTGTPVIVMEHGSAIAIESDYYWRKRVVARRYRDRLTKPLLRASAVFLHAICLRLATGALLAGEESTAHFLAAGVRPERMMMYHFPVDLDRFRPPEADERLRLRHLLELPPDRVLVVSVSRLTPEKGIDVLIQAVADMPPEERPFLVIGGTGPLRETLQRSADAHHLDARFVGELGPDAVASLLRACDVFVYAGRQGANTPYAVLEAMASGLAVVATTEPLVHEQMLEDGRGIAIPADDRAAMTAALSHFVANVEARLAAGTAARRYIEERHAPERFDSEVEDFLAWLARLREDRSQ